MSQNKSSLSPPLATNGPPGAELGGPVVLAKQQLRQLGDIRRDPPTSFARELTARPKRQGQNCLPGLICDDHHQR